MIDATQLARDLRVFADPATDFRAKEAGGRLWLDFLRDGSERSYAFDLRSGECTTRSCDNRRHSSVQALLASDEFVNLRAFKATQRRLLASKNPADYINPEGEIIARDGSTQPLSIEGFRAVMARNGASNLTMLLLDGPAGIGKTSLLERMVFERADPSSLEPPLLHVVSSGSRLTDLSKALAHASQLLRSSITFDQVPILVRLGVLQVAIDGFDELVDPEGYKDAWAALRQFLSEVQYGGPVVLSGRDTFFDQQSFEERVAARLSNLRLVHARLHAVSPHAAVTFLRKHGWSDSELKSAESREWFRPGSYRLRPFFLTQIGAAGSWAELESAHGSPQYFIVSRFVSREADLIARMVEISREMAEEALWEFYGLVVEDMATNETEFVDEPFLALACESAFESRVAGDDLAKLVFKAGSFGLLETDGTTGFRRLPHSELQNQFLARVLVRGLGSSAAVSSFLRRGAVSAGLLEAFVDVITAIDLVSAERVRSRLLRSVQEEAFSERQASNCAALAVAALARPDLPVLELGSVAISEAKIVGTAGAANLDGLVFSHLDIRGADCRSVAFRACEAGALTVDGFTYLGASGAPKTRLLRAEEAGSVNLLRAPQEIAVWVSEHSASSGGSVGEEDLPLVRYFDRLCRKFVRQHQIWASAEDEAYFLLKDSQWEVVKPLLGARLVLESREARGPRRSFYRLSRPEALLSPPAGDIESQAIRAAVIIAAAKAAKR